MKDHLLVPEKCLDTLGALMTPGNLGEMFPETHSSVEVHNAAVSLLLLII